MGWKNRMILLFFSRLWRKTFLYQKNFFFCRKVFFLSSLCGGAISNVFVLSYLPSSTKFAVIFSLRLSTVFESFFKLRHLEFFSVSRVRSMNDVSNLLRKYKSTWKRHNRLLPKIPLSAWRHNCTPGISKFLKSI